MNFYSVLAYNSFLASRTSDMFSPKLVLGEYDLKHNFHL